ncbi:hypothetical protein OSCI_1460030 [Kamptonema sp. PCC 6506]|nr:hypothetical protein OSCI_1460030 [Kamptonema sp. PCC 6506]
MLGYLSLGLSDNWSRVSLRDQKFNLKIHLTCSYKLLLANKLA